MSIDAMKQALTALERGETQLRYEAITALRAAIEEEELNRITLEEQETVTYDTGGFELEARFYSGAELREMIKALDAMNASVRRMMGEI
jgi:hypothetical protein